MSTFSTTAPAGGNIFGQAAQQGTNTTGGFFGTTPAAVTGGGGLFGTTPATGTATGTGTGTGGGIFGGGSMFGGQQQPQQQPQQQQPQQQGGGLFNLSTTGTTGTTGGLGLFGTNQPQQQQQQQQQPQQTGGGLFGNPSGGGFLGTQSTGLFPGFGGGQQQQQQPQQQQGGGFFQQQSTFGGGMQNSMMGSSFAASQNAQAPGNRVVNELKKVLQKWDRNSPDCEFKVYFYNNVGPDNASRHVKPMNEDEKAYDKAWTERPNSGAVPVLAIGFGDLEIRVKSQQNQVYAFRTTLHAIQEKLATLQQKHDLVTSIKLEDCRRRHISLARRALALAAQVQVLKNRGYALQPEEEQLKKRLDALSRQVYDGSIVGRVNEIWARMTVVRERVRMMEGELESKGGVEWDEKQLKVTGELLGQNARGLEFLTKEVKAIEQGLADLEEEMRNGSQGR